MKKDLVKGIKKISYKVEYDNGEVYEDFLLIGEDELVPGGIDKLGVVGIVDSRENIRRLIEEVFTLIGDQVAEKTLDRVFGATLEELLAVKE